MTALDGTPPRVLMERPCGHDPLGWTKDNRVFVVESCREAGAQVGQEEERTFLVDARSGNEEEVFLPFEGGSPIRIHPDGRHLLAHDPTVDDPEGGYVNSIVDLETGDIQHLPTFQGMGQLYGADGGYPGEAQVEGDRFLYVDGDPERFGLRLMSVRPGEAPEILWALPEELVREGFLGRPSASPIGVLENRVASIHEEISPDTLSTLMVTDMATGETTEMGTLRGFLHGPMWSRDGQKIALDYPRPGNDRHAFAVFNFDDAGDPLGDPTILDSRTSSASIEGWTAGSDALVFGASGIESRLGAFFLIPVAEGSNLVDITPNDPDPFTWGYLSLGGDFLAYPSRTFAGSSIWRFDFSEDGGGQSP